MTKHLAISTVLAAALAAGSAYAAGDMDRSAGMQGGGATAAAASGESQSTESVRMIQQALQNEGYNVQVDGIYGPNTQQALQQFQERHGSVAQGGAGSGMGSPQTAEGMSGGMGTERAPGYGDPAAQPEAGAAGAQGQTAEELGWDRAGGIRNPDTGTDEALGTGRGETGAGGGGAGGGAGGAGGAGGGAGGQ